ncbi:MAG: uL15 family ribosomal protein [Nanoarchaeota archaeon]|nr:uL15 family ribosomal protein [Nanoarchaeota archaeon]
MKLKKRTKRSRLRGAETCGWGFRQKHRGSGHKGGVGMAGSGRHKKQMALNMADGGKYFGRRGFTSKPTAKKINKVLNLQEIKNNYSTKEINLKDYKILGKGEGFNAIITAESASKSAIEKMEKAGGKIIVSKVAKVKKVKLAPVVKEKDKAKDKAKAEKAKENKGKLKPQETEGVLGKEVKAEKPIKKEKAKKE